MCEWSTSSFRRQAQEEKKKLFCHVKFSGGSKRDVSLAMSKAKFGNKIADGCGFGWNVHCWSLEGVSKAKFGEQDS